jgi:hypothetical protein
VAVGSATGKVILGILAGGSVAYAMLGLIWTLEGLYIRLRFSERAAEIAAERACPNCAADDAIGIEDANIETCPACGEKSLSFPSVGIS